MVWCMGLDTMTPTGVRRGMSGLISLFTELNVAGNTSGRISRMIRFLESCTFLDIRFLYFVCNLRPIPLSPAVLADVYMPTT